MKTCIVIVALFVSLAALSQKRDWNTDNLRGAVKKITEYKTDGSTEVRKLAYVTLYNEKGLLMFGYNYVFEEWTDSFVYDSLDRLMNEKRVKADGELIYHLSYFYNEKNQLAKTIEQTRNPNDNNILLCSYDGEGRVNKNEWTDLKGSYKKHQVITFYKDTIWEKTYEGQKFTAIKTHITDSAGHKLQSVIQDSPGWNKMKYIRQFNENGLEINCVDYLDGERGSEFRYAYDVYNNKVLIVFVNKLGEAQAQRIEYKLTYDSNGNILKSVRIDNGTVHYTREYEYEYYPSAKN